jgi:hypothetical protein
MLLSLWLVIMPFNKSIGHYSLARIVNNMIGLIIVGSIHSILLDELIMGCAQRRIGPFNLGGYGFPSPPINGRNPIISQFLVPKLHFMLTFICPIETSLIPLLVYRNGIQSALASSDHRLLFIPSFDYLYLYHIPFIPKTPYSLYLYPSFILLLCYGVLSSYSTLFYAFL